MASEGSELPEFPMVSRKRKRVSPDNIEETDQSRYDYTSEISESSSNYDAQDSLEEPDNELGKAQLDSVDDVELDPSEQEPEQGEVLWSEDREQYPEQPAYHEDIKGHKDRLIQILDELVDRFSTISGKSEAAKMLHAELCKLRVFPKPKVPVIALLGDSGTGKSALVSAIVDIPHVAREGNFGSACTNVIIEYCNAFLDQTKKLAAKVEFLDAEQRRALLTEHLRDYMHFNFEKQKDWTSDEKRYFSLQAKTAEDTFLNLFRGKPSFGTRAEIKIILQSVFEGENMTSLITQLEVWCEQLISDHNTTTSAVIENDRAFKLNKTLAPFLTSSATKRSEPSLWPVVHKVTIGIQGSRVLQHVTIADMPGTSDINRVRVKSSTQYVRSSDHLWIVAPIARCVTDDSVDTILCNYGERFADRLALICTKIDDSMECVDFAREYEDDAEPMREFKERRDTARKALTQAKAAAKRASDLSTIQSRHAQVQKCQAEYEKRSRNLFHFMITTRNRRVVDAIYDQKSEHLSRHARSVFPVSSKQYSWLKGFKGEGNESELTFKPSLTGIPALRKYALSIPAQEMWSTDMTHIQHAIVGCIKASIIWTNNSARDESTLTSDVHHKTRKAVEIAKGVYLSTLKCEAAKHLVTPIKQARKYIADEADDYFMKKVKTWPWITIKAFVAREGRFASRSSVGKAVWNEKMMIPAVVCLESEWKKLTLKEGCLLDNMENNVLGQVDRAVDERRKTMAHLQIPITQLEQFLGAQKCGLASHFDQYRKSYDKAFRNIRQITEKDDADGYFAVAMRPAYHKAQEIKGTGYKENVLGLLRDHIAQRADASPFVEMAKSAAENIHREAGSSLTTLHTQCDKTFSHMLAWLESRTHEDDNDDETLAADKSDLRDVLIKRDEEIAGIVQSFVAIEQNPTRKSEPEPKAKPKANLKLKLKFNPQPHFTIKQERDEMTHAPEVAAQSESQETEVQSGGLEPKVEPSSPKTKKVKVEMENEVMNDAD